MAEIVFANAAEADLVEIDAYSVANFGEQTAARYMHGFTAAFARLARSPFSGRSASDVGVGLRCLRQGRHPIYFQLDGNEVLIVRVLHHAMDATRALGAEPQ